LTVFVSRVRGGMEIYIYVDWQGGHPINTLYSSFRQKECKWTKKIWSGDFHRRYNTFKYLG